MKLLLRTVLLAVASAGSDGSPQPARSTRVFAEITMNRLKLRDGIGEIKQANDSGGLADRRGSLSLPDGAVHFGVDTRMHGRRRANDGEQRSRLRESVRSVRGAQLP